jgi:hypothetical protein
VPALYCEPEDHSAPIDDDGDRPWPPPAKEWCLLAEDLISVRIAETDTWVAHAVTAEYALGHARWSTPALVLREREETVDEESLTFLLLAFRSESDEGPRALFGECAMSTALYRTLRKPYGVREPLPREANPPFPDEELPTEFDKRCWAELLDDGG